MMVDCLVRKAVPPPMMFLEERDGIVRGAEKSEYPGGVASISSEGVVVERTQVSESAMMSGLK